MNFLPYFLTFICSMIGAVAQMFFYFGMKSFQFNTPHHNYKLAIGLGLYGVATIIYLFAVKIGDFRIIYPILAFSYIWVFILSYYLLHQPITIYHIIGSMVVIVGVAVINFKTY